jgi:hypothetical protein
MTAAPDSTDPDRITHRRFFERHIARLVVILYFCGRPVRSMFEGETRQVDTLWELQRFDFWVREPGHLAMALLSGATPEDTVRREAVDRMMAGGAIDQHRVNVFGAPAHGLEDFDASIAYLTSRGLVTDRPSFMLSRSYGHQIILEAAGIALAERILTECPSYGWYRQQCAIVATFSDALSVIDLDSMPYLAPDLTPSQASSMPMMPYVRARYDRLYRATPEPAPAADSIAAGDEGRSDAG